MKITGQVIPPTFAELYRDLISNNPDTGGGNLTARTRRAARNAPRRQKSAWVFLQCSKAVDALLRALGYEKGTKDFNDRHYIELRRLIEGEIDPAYWLKLHKYSSSFFSSLPTSVLDPAPGPYSYRSPTMQPSIPTYPDGTPDGGPARTSGAVNVDMWEDGTFAWQKTIWQLQGKLEAQEITPLFVVHQPTITVSTSARGSRPMFSLLARLRLGTWEAPILTDPSPPLIQTRSYYWRYINPTDTPPYYQIVKPRRIFCFPRQKDRTDAAAEPAFLSADIGPRPMLGHGFNNCLIVNIDHTGEPDAYMLNPCAGRKSSPVAYQEDSEIYLLDIDTGEWQWAHSKLGYGKWAFRQGAAIAWSSLTNIHVIDAAWNDTGVILSAPGFSPMIEDPQAHPLGWCLKMQSASEPGFPKMVIWSPTGTLLYTAPDGQYTNGGISSATIAPGFFPVRTDHPWLVLYSMKGVPTYQVTTGFPNWPPFAHRDCLFIVVPGTELFKFPWPPYREDYPGYELNTAWVASADYLGYTVPVGSQVCVCTEGLYVIPPTGSAKIITPGGAQITKPRPTTTRTLSKYSTCIF